VANIFVSYYTSDDRDWAFWIAQELLKLGHEALHPSRRIAEPVIGRAFARPVGDAPQDEVC
jgi:hypothetical protein